MTAETVGGDEGQGRPQAILLEFPAKLSHCPMPGGEILADVSFEAEVIEWRGPAPFYFVVVPSEHVDEVRYAARLASYGWGVVPVEATLGDINFGTSLFPRNGGYLLPLKASVRKAAKLELGMPVRVRMQIASTSPHSWPPDL